MMKDPERDALDQLVGAFKEPTAGDTVDFLLLPDRGRLLFAGTGATAILPPTLVQAGGSGLYLPAASGPSPMDFGGAYVTLKEYMPLGAIGPVELPDEVIVRFLASSHPREIMLVALSYINAAVEDDEKRRALTEEFQNRLKGDAAVKLQSILASGPPGSRRITSRQPILAAMRYLLTMPDVTPRGSPDAGLAAVLLAQAVADSLDASDEMAGETMVGHEAHLVLELVRVGLLHEWVDYYTAVGRVLRLWRIYGAQVSVVPLRSQPANLLREATGFEIEELLSLGFAILAHSLAWEPGKPPFLAADLGSEWPRERLEAFLSLVCDDVAGFGSAFAGHDSRFDFLPIEMRPVLRIDQGLLVLDQGFLWERITSGLFWFVHDAERARSDLERQRWTQAYGEMIERMVEEKVGDMDVPLLGGGGRNLYSEEDLERAYGGKKSDIALFTGTHFVLWEVVSGHLTIDTRIQGNRERFFLDTEKLVMKKCRQLDATARAIIEGERALTGFDPTPQVHIFPVVVASEGYPVNPFTTQLIRESAAAELLFQDPRIEPVCVIDIGELDALQGLAQKGYSVGEVLIGWQTSGLSETALATYLASTPRFNVGARPTADATAAEELLDAIPELIRLRGRPGAEST